MPSVEAIHLTRTAGLIQRHELGWDVIRGPLGRHTRSRLAELPRNPSGTSGNFFVATPSYGMVIFCSTGGAAPAVQSQTHSLVITLQCDRRFPLAVDADLRAEVSLERPSPLRVARILRGLRLYDVAKAARITEAKLSRGERGGVPLTPEELERLRKFYARRRPSTEQGAATS